MANKYIFDTPVHKGLWYICLCGNNFSLKKSPPCLTAACLLKNIFDRMNSISVVAILQWSKNATKLVLVSWILGYDEYDFFCNFKRFDCFPSSGTQGLPPPVRAFLVAGLDLSTRAWRDARSPSGRPCGRPLTLTHTQDMMVIAHADTDGHCTGRGARPVPDVTRTCHDSRTPFHPSVSCSLLSPSAQHWPGERNNTLLCSERWAG